MNTPALKSQPAAPIEANFVIARSADAALVVVVADAPQADKLNEASCTLDCIRCLLLDVVDASAGDNSEKLLGVGSIYSILRQIETAQALVNASIEG